MGHRNGLAVPDYAVQGHAQRHDENGSGSEGAINPHTGSESKATGTEGAVNQTEAEEERLASAPPRAGAASRVPAAPTTDEFDGSVDSAVRVHLFE
jgi:hypothetical protein